MSDYANTLQNAHLIRMMAQNLDSYGALDEAIEQADRADSVGAILDPTAYRANVDKLREDRETLAAVRALGRLGATASEGKAP